MGRKRGRVEAVATSDSLTLLRDLRALYAAIDRAFDGWACASSTDCCRFGVTGREPYPTAIELAELERAVRARGGLPKRRALPIASEKRCRLLGDDGRCLVYESRPFGCRTFFCQKAKDAMGQALPKRTIDEVSRAVAELSAKFRPADPGPRPLSRATSKW